MLLFTDVVHVHCLSIYVKKLLKESNILKCPTCTRSLWLQNDDSNLQNTTEVDYNELSPVALTLYNHLLNHGEWWGHSLITNEKVCCFIMFTYYNIAVCLYALVFVLIIEMYFKGGRY